MADKNLTVGIDIKANTAEAKAAAAAIDNVAAASKRATVTSNSMKEAEKQLAQQNTQTSMGIMAMSNAFQDAQYGMQGMINNIPGIVSGMGLGMGVAGVMQVVAVGLKIVNDNFDVFGTKAKEASEAANKEAAELMELANKAYIAEKASLAMAAAQEKQADAAQVINGHYQEQIRLSNEIIAQKKAQADAEIASADAEAAVAMARLQLMEATGQVTKEQAMIQRGQIQMQADARKQAASEAAETAKMIELRRQANAEEEKANALRRSAQELAGKGGGLMTAEQAETARKTIAGLEGGMVASQAAQAEFASQKQTTKLRLEQEKYQEMITRLEEEKAKLAAHEKAVKEAGVKSADELNKLVESQVEEARKSASAASQFRGQANATENAIVRGRGIFGLRQEAAAIGTMAGVEGERARQREEAQRAAEKAAAAREKGVSEAGAAGTKLAEALAGSANPAFVRQLASASSSGDIGALIAMMEKLMANQRNLTEQQRSRLQKLEAEIEDLRTAR